MLSWFNRLPFLASGRPAARKKVFLITAMRNEAPYILEFVAHYQLLGFDALYFATNDSTDDTLFILRSLEAAGCLRVFEHTDSNKPQRHGNRLCLKKIREEHTDFFALNADADEFLVLYKHDDIVDYANSLSAFDVVVVNWKFFGSDGHLTRPKGLVVENYLHHGDAAHQGSRGVKSMAQFPGRVLRVGVHYPLFDDVEAAKACYSDGVAFPAETAGVRPGETGVEPHYDGASIHHYGLKSWDEFLIRRARGRGAGPSHPERHTDAYFSKYDRADVYCPDLKLRAPALRARMRELFAAAKLADRFDETYFGI
ncbi:glycosyltransferase family 2 protein [Methylopila sp. M107]|uniref:glycosyltransferase family 2 protein n=1 Tax=Methylopila sp. M107 TaxID=1101190 RepID=UPI000366B919|nr:glycosyltransferase family 2 protein [Methylopila sp. M107]